MGIFTRFRSSKKAAGQAAGQAANARIDVEEVPVPYRHVPRHAAHDCRTLVSHANYEEFKPKVRASVRSIEVSEISQPNSRRTSVNSSNASIAAEPVAESSRSTSHLRHGDIGVYTATWKDAVTMDVPQNQVPPSNTRRTLASYPGGSYDAVRKTTAKSRVSVPKPKPKPAKQSRLPFFRRKSPLSSQLVLTEQVEETAEETAAAPVAAVPDISRKPSRNPSPSFSRKSENSSNSSMTPPTHPDNVANLVGANPSHGELRTVVFRGEDRFSCLAMPAPAVVRSAIV